MRIKMKCSYETCKRKVNSFTNIKCTCGNIYCDNHRLMSDHKCKYTDTKQEKYIEHLRVSNPVVKKDKFQKIG